MWNDSGNEKDISDHEFDNESDEDYRHESGLHWGEKMARSKRVNRPSSKDKTPKLGLFINFKAFFPAVSRVSCYLAYIKNLNSIGKEPQADPHLH